MNNMNREKVKFTLLTRSEGLDSRLQAVKTNRILGLFRTFPGCRYLSQGSKGQ